MKIPRNQLPFGTEKSEVTFVHKTLCNNFENGGLKHVDIFSKIISLQCSWL